MNARFFDSTGGTACRLAGILWATAAVVGSPPPAFAGSSPGAADPPADGGVAVVPSSGAGERGGWKLSVGAVWREFGDVRVHTGERSPGVRLPSIFGAATRVPPPGIGPADRVADRVYADGFVRLDSGTVASEDGLTWFWGYEAADQVRGDRIGFHSGVSGRQTEIDRRSAGGAGDAGWEADGGTGGGPLVELEFTRPVGESGVLFGGHVHFAFLQAEVDRSGLGSFRARESARRYGLAATDAYALGGVVPPPAPHAGSFGGPGPLIPNRPDERVFTRSPVGREGADFFNVIEESLEIDLFTIGAAVEASVEGERWSLGLAAGPTVSVADWDGEHRERLLVSRNGARPEVVREWREGDSGTEVVIGAFVQLGVGVRVSERIVIEGFVRYDWAESLEGRIGPSSFDAELGGLGGGAMIGIRF